MYSIYIHLECLHALHEQFGSECGHDYYCTAVMEAAENHGGLSIDVKPWQHSERDVLPGVCGKDCI